MNAPGTLLATALACSLSVFLAACGGTYEPATLSANTPDGNRTVGCLDVAVDGHSDPQAAGPVAKITVGNRCNTAVVVDYRAIRATVRYRDGHIGRSEVYDPNYSLRPVTLDARRQGWEAFEYHPTRVSEHSRVPETLCLDLAGLDRDQPALQPVEACVSVDAKVFDLEEVI